MSIEKCREEFEASVLSEYPNQNMGKFATGEYQSTTIEHCWWAWKASREALVIELPASPYMPDSEPESMTGYEIGEAQGRCDMWASVREAIESAGLKVTP
jgi:hypothetical protein